MIEDLMVEDVLGKLCLIDLDGEIVVDPEEYYDSIYYPSNGLCQVERDGKYGYID